MLTQLFIHNNYSMSAGGSAELVIIISASRIIVLLKTNHETLQEQSEDNLMVAISRGVDNGSYTMAAWPIKSLELHYSMIQFLIIAGICW